MRIFHGSDSIVDAPKTNFGRKNLDFGCGFYVTKLEKQASKWAFAVAERKGPYSPAILNEYEFNYEAAVSQFHILQFEVYNLDWLEYVVACRRGKPIWKDYDIIEGGVANDNVIDTVEDYENGRITAEQALDQLRFKKPNHQICIINQDVVDLYIQFVQHRVLEEKV